MNYTAQPSVDAAVAVAVASAPAADSSSSWWTAAWGFAAAAIAVAVAYASNAWTNTVAPATVAGAGLGAASFAATAVFTALGAVADALAVGIVAANNAIPAALASAGTWLSSLVPASVSSAAGVYAAHVGSVLHGLVPSAVANAAATAGATVGGWLTWAVGFVPAWATSPLLLVVVAGLLVVEWWTGSIFGICLFGSAGCATESAAEGWIPVVARRFIQLHGDFLEAAFNRHGRGAGGDDRDDGGDDDVGDQNPFTYIHGNVALYCAVVTLVLLLAAPRGMSLRVRGAPRLVSSAALVSISFLAGYLLVDPFLRAQVQRARAEAFGNATLNASASSAKPHLPRPTAFLLFNTAPITLALPEMYARCNKTTGVSSVDRQSPPPRLDQHLSSTLAAAGVTVPVSYNGQIAVAAGGDSPAVPHGLGELSLCNSTASAAECVDSLQHVLVEFSMGALVRALPLRLTRTKYDYRLASLAHNLPALQHSNEQRTLFTLLLTPLRFHPNVTEHTLHRYYCSQDDDVVQAMLEDHAALALRAMPELRARTRVLCGISGTGKTHLSVITYALRHGISFEEASRVIMRINMGSFNSEHSLNSLLDVPPGISGEARLVRYLRNNSAGLVLLDEFDKVPVGLREQVLNVFLSQWEDRGNLVTPKGEVLPTYNLDYILTANFDRELDNVSKYEDRPHKHYGVKEMIELWGKAGNATAEERAMRQRKFRKSFLKRSGSLSAGDVIDSSGADYVDLLKKGVQEQVFQLIAAASPPLANRIGQKKILTLLPSTVADWERIIHSRLLDLSEFQLAIAANTKNDGGNERANQLRRRPKIEAFRFVWTDRFVAALVQRYREEPVATHALATEVDEPLKLCAMHCRTRRPAPCVLAVLDGNPFTSGSGIKGAGHSTTIRDIAQSTWCRVFASDEEESLAEILLPGSHLRSQANLPSLLELFASPAFPHESAARDRANANGTTECQREAAEDRRAHRRRLREMMKQRLPFARSGGEDDAGTAAKAVVACGWAAVAWHFAAPLVHDGSNGWLRQSLWPALVHYTLAIAAPVCALTSLSADLCWAVVCAAAASLAFKLGAELFSRVGLAVPQPAAQEPVNNSSCASSDAASVSWPAVHSSRRALTKEKRKRSKKHCAPRSEKTAGNNNDDDDG